MKKHILLIDDDEDELIIFMDLLKKVNIPYKCTWAKSGEQALCQLAYLSPDIIFLDINMPGMNGFDCLAAIKRAPHLQHIPVVLHSTTLPENYRAKGIALGALACLEKPATISGLEEMLREVRAIEAIFSNLA